ncbi:glycosyltransferase family 4 protein [Acetobacter fallax]|uniref:Glycosyltransferase n=1 Tax=Acetobacter fallax TaxID=1737473 RepID=A0ABX0K993_9PROT|nr:glycosyltransferase family 1 protein [Acetobacter fallax]NHO32525.1 glycosyltransferase [Acetobacter fallax]NHO36131.1 glycosyltransferase [Acetobacter fallax]
MSRTLWIDISDLLHYLAHHNRPSGIQRVVFELGRALVTLAPSQVRFVQRTGGPSDFETVDWSYLQALFTTVTSVSSGPRQAISESAPASKKQIDTFIQPPETETTLPAALRTQINVLRQLATMPREIIRYGLQRAEIQRSARIRRQTMAAKANRPVMPDRRIRLADAAKAGDVFFVPGSPWHHADYVRTVRWLRDDLRIAFGLLIHDLIPVRHPEWCDRGVITTFTQWHRSILPLADHVFVTSRSVVSDVEAYAAEEGIVFDNPVTPVGMGSTFGVGTSAITEEATYALSDEGGIVSTLPAAGNYVLFVSTIEARKNHSLLFRVWRRLLEERPADQVPTLVFAGRAGWLVSDLMQQLENADWLGGKIRMISNPTDGELAALYRGCLFTLFPSLFEGWGLPVTESLAFGRPCIASNATSIPEAGGALAKYFDPEDLDDALRVIGATIDDPKGLDEWQKRVAAEYKPASWEEPGRRILTGYDL